MGENVRALEGSAGAKGTKSAKLKTAFGLLPINLFPILLLFFTNIMSENQEDDYVIFCFILVYIILVLPPCFLSSSAARVLRLETAKSNGVAP